MYFITFEGPEGSGKSTQINKLSSFLKKKGLKLIKTREPGGSRISEKIRRILLDRKNKKLCAGSELLLYLASRAQHIEDVIKPALKNKTIVLCDRFSDSTLAYQGYGRGIPLKTIRTMNNFATGGLKPDLTFVFDIPVKKGLLLAGKFKGRKDRLELEKVNFHRKVRLGFLKIAGSEPNRVKVVKVDGSIEDIHQIIIAYVNKLFKRG